MKITNTFTYDIPFDIEQYDLTGDKILVLRYPLYKVAVKQITDIAEAINRECWKFKAVCVPDEVSLEIMPTWELEKLAAWINNLLSDRKNMEDLKPINR